MRTLNITVPMISGLFLAITVFAALVAVGSGPEQPTAGTANGAAHEQEAEAATVNQTTETALATFGAGCFWGVEATFRQLEGVVATQVGYAGGRADKPTYEQVCSGTTGHAEVVRVEYDPHRVSYSDLLTVFWDNHDPTQVNRQGPDVGEQYRSVIYYHSTEQERWARESRDALDSSGSYSRPIATKIEQAGDFWRAEEYHQQYLEKRGLSTCRIK